jgi:2-polyprenyl-3-methyl-5-hydroxy-6-metoxy-1,4-benzoquinol methylase
MKQNPAHEHDEGKAASHPEPEFVRHEIRWTAEKSRRLWDYYGSQPAYAGAFFGYQAGRYVARAIFRHGALPPDARILDFSCGRGDIIGACLQRMSPGQRIFGTDFTATYVDAVQKRFEGHAQFGGTRLSTSFPTPFDDRSFDLVYATEVIEHLDDAELDGLLAECRRLLKPAGRVVFTTPNEEPYDASMLLCPDCGCMFHKWQHVRVWTRDSLVARMESAGLRTRIATPMSWQSLVRQVAWAVKHRRTDKGGLFYVGQTPA